MSRIKDFFSAIFKDIKNCDRGYDIEAEAVADKNCKECNGKGWIWWHPDTESGRVQAVCKCVKLRSVE